MKKLGKIELYKILYKVVLLQPDTYIEQQQQQQQQQQQNTFIQTATHDTQELLEVGTVYRERKGPRRCR